LNQFFYNRGCQLVNFLLRCPWLPTLFSLLAKVWLRQAKTVGLLQRWRFDGVIDGGANIGEFASLVRWALPQASLLCVEPHPDCARVLRRKGFQVVEAALWHESGRLTLVQPDGATTSSTVTSSLVLDQQWSVPSVRLDSLTISGRRLLIKLDLQGAELSALRGLDLLWDRCAAILIETPILDRTRRLELEKILLQHGFLEHSTINELLTDGLVIEADKFWLRQDLLKP
jgi:FkbM family methyltransferase